MSNENKKLKKAARYGVVLCGINMFAWVVYSSIRIKLYGNKATIGEIGGWWMVGMIVIFLVCFITLEGKSLIQSIKNYLK